MTTSLNEDISITVKEESEAINRNEGKENIILICFDPDNELNDNIEHLKIRLHQITNHVVLDTDLESCITFIRSIENRGVTRHSEQEERREAQDGYSLNFGYLWRQILKIGRTLCKRISNADRELSPMRPTPFMPLIGKEKIFLIILGSSTSLLLHITTLHQVDSIFIFCLENDQYEDLLVENSKIIGIYDEFDSLCSSIEEQIDLVDKQFNTWCFFDQHEYATKDLSKQSSDFLWLQLLHDVLLHFPRDEQAKKQMIDACRHYYRGNRKDLRLIDKFEREYKSKEAIRWYLKSSFLQKMTKKAFRTENTDQLYTLRYFLGDLLENLNREHQQIVQSERENLLVYLGLVVSGGELDKLKENKGKCISMKEFSTATRVRSSAVTLATNFTKQADIIIVLFEIECDIQELNDSTIFADITHFSEPPYQEEILFDFNVTFRLENIHQDKEIWIIKMTAVSDGQTIVEKYIHDTHRQIEDLSISIIFGKLLCDMSQWDQSQKYFEHLLNNPHNEDLAWIEHNIGLAHYWKGEWNEAQIYYDRAYDRMIQVEPIRVKDSANVLADISKLLHLQGKYEEAYDFVQQALTIQKKYYFSGHMHIATSLETIGLIENRRLKDDEALVFFQQALTIREEYYNYFHVDIAHSLTNIGDTLASQEKYDDALDYYRRAMSIYETYYPSGHVSTAWCLNGIGCILSGQEKYDEVFNIVQRALTMLKKYYPYGHINIASSLAMLGNIKYAQGKYDEALDYYQQVLSIEMKYYSPGHTAIVCTLDSMGHIQSNGKGNFDEAHELHQRALTMLKTYYPSYYGHIAQSLNYIGHNLSRQGKYNEAFDFFKQALAMQERYYPPNNVNIASSLNNIGNILFGLRKYDEAVESHEKALAIQRKCYESDNVQIASSLYCMGIVRYGEEKYEEAIDCYQQAVAICEKNSRSYQATIAIFLSNIGDALDKQEKYDEAFEYQQRALSIRESHYPSGYMNIADSFKRMGNIRNNQRKYDEAIDFYQQALAIYEKYSLTSHVDIPKNLMCIGHIRYEQRKLDEAIDYYHLAVAILEEHHPTDHINIAGSLDWIASIWNEKQCYDHSAEYLAKCLRIREVNLTPGHWSIVAILSRFGLLQYNRHQYELALAYQLKYFSIQEKILPPDHQNIGQSLANIGHCYEQLNKHNLALDYYKQALAVYEQCLPDWHENRQQMKSNIERLSEV